MGFARHGDRERLEPVIATLGPPGPLHSALAEGGVSNFALSWRGRRDTAGAVARLTALLRRERADVVQTHLLDSCLIGLTAACLAGVRVRIYTGHHSHEAEPGSRHPAYLADRACRSLLATTIIAPSAYHRINFRESDKEQMLKTSNGLALGGLFFLALSIIGAVVLIADFIYGSTAAVVSASIGAVLFATLWLVLPIVRRDPDKTPD